MRSNLPIRVHVHEPVLFPTFCPRNGGFSHPTSNILDVDNRQRLCNQSTRKLTRGIQLQTSHFRPRSPFVFQEGLTFSQFFGSSVPDFSTFHSYISSYIFIIVPSHLRQKHTSLYYVYFTFGSDGIGSFTTTINILSYSLHSDACPRRKSDPDDISYCLFAAKFSCLRHEQRGRTILDFVIGNRCNSKLQWR